MFTLHNFKEITYLCGNANIVAAMPDVPLLPIFSAQVKDFLHALSVAILKDKRMKTFPDVASLAFWLRKANIDKLHAQTYHNISNRIGRGVAFHIAPSNIPVNFAVSMTSALLAGNACVVRVSNKDFEQVSIICDAINKVIQKQMPEMAKYVCIIRYEHSLEITQCLSAICDLRIIWGGNKTIEEIRKAMLPPRSIEMVFADRHSFAVINADEYLKGDFAAIAEGFYIDTYFVDQNACSSPRCVVWMGAEIEKAQDIFWQTLEEKLVEKYDLMPIQAVNKWNTFCKFAALNPDSHLIQKSNYLTRIAIDTLPANLMDFKENSGFFYEYKTQNIENIVPLLTKPCQTITYYGVAPETIKNVVLKYGTRGVDRIVKLGTASDIDLIWDGYDMVKAMSRILYLG